MDSEDDNIFYSLDNLNTLMETSGLKSDAAIEKFLREVMYPPVSDFKPGLEWFNVAEPISLAKHLKGKIVVLDFFTYCCINCMHVLPDLKELESRFTIEDGVVVIGVHSAKFENEKLSGNILSAVQRYSITHPVVNDSTCDMWKKCEVHCWPTLLILGPGANPLIMMMGEGHRERLLLFVNEALKFYKSRDLISDHSLPVQSSLHLLPELKGPLLFPGKVAMIHDGVRDVLAISDTGNSRVLIALDGVIVQQVGGTKTGFKDGSLENAEFNQPQGLAFQNAETLYLADTENHAIRKIDLKSRLVTTVAGNGTQTDDSVGGKVGTDQGISSPWDLCVYNFESSRGDFKDVIIVAMAGTHQIWAIFLNDTVWWKSKEYGAGTVVCIAGNGKEENRNNQYPNNAAFAQPSGLALSRRPGEVFIADSESSSVRKMSLETGKVSPVVGGDRNPNNLFAFGDKDGILYEAKLQHPLGLALSKDEETVFVADTYNHKIRKISLSTNSISAVKLLDDPLSTFNEPGGLCLSPDGTKLYVADTNNHCIKQLTLDRMDNIADLIKIDFKLEDDPITHVDKSDMEVITSEAIKLSSKGGKIILNIHLSFVNNLELTVGAPNKWVCKVPNSLWSCVPNGGTVAKHFNVVLNVVPDRLDTCFVDVVLNILTCRQDVCYPKKFIIRQPVEYDALESITVNKNITVVLDPSKIKLK